MVYIIDKQMLKNFYRISQYAIFDFLQHFEPIFFGTNNLWLPLFMIQFLVHG